MDLAISALPSEADIRAGLQDVFFVPKAEVGWAAAARRRSIARPSSRKTASTILNEVQQFNALQ
jgi:hypothetical protein